MNETQGFLKVGKRPSFDYDFVVKQKTRKKKVKMKSTIAEDGKVIDMGSLYNRFHKLQDTRKDKGKRYELGTIMILMIMAKLSGEDHPSGIAEWAANREKELVDMLKLKYPKMPHHSTYRRIIREVVSAEELEGMVGEYLETEVLDGKPIQISVDGKILRGTLDEAQNGTYLLAAYLPEEGIVLMEIAIEGKGKEIPGAKQLLKMVDLRGKIVIGDALHTQRETSEIICEAGGEYIWYAKGNQSFMENNIALWFQLEPPPIPGTGNPPKKFSSAKKVSKGHGRIEVREIVTSSELNTYFDWPGLAQVFMLKRRTTFTKTGEVKESIVYGFTSLSQQEASPKELLALIRSYWGIENGLHYRRDVTLREDATRMTKGNAGHIMACLNNLVIGLLIGKQGFKYLPSARRYLNANIEQAFDLITGL